jgi:hypothetical protein
MKSVNTTTHFIFLCLALSTVSSCYTLDPDPFIVPLDRQQENKFYKHSVHNAPLLSKKNNLSTSFLFSTTASSEAIDLQAAYMPLQHIGITTNYTGGTRTSYTNYNRFEAGIGYVADFKKGWNFETYTGLGSGKVINHHYTGSSTIKNNLFYIQPAISASSAKRTVQFAAVSRLTGVNFKVTDTSFNTAREPYNKSQLQSLQNKPFHIIWEPGFVFKFGWQKVLFAVAYSYAEDLSNSSLNISDYTFSFGTSLRFNVSKKHLALK